MRDFDFFFAAANGFPRLRPFSSPYSINIQNQTKGSFSKEAFFPSFLLSAPHFLEIDGKRRKVRSADAFSTLEMCESLFWQTEECVLCNRALVEIRTFLRKSPPLLPRTIIYHLHYYTNKKASFFPEKVLFVERCRRCLPIIYIFDICLSVRHISMKKHLFLVADPPCWEFLRCCCPDPGCPCGWTACVNKITYLFTSQMV